MAVEIGAIEYRRDETLDQISIRFAVTNLLDQDIVASLNIAAISV